MVTSEELNMTFQKVGNDFGFEEVKAEFAPFSDLKIRWRRTCCIADFTVSDYLQDAPEDVIEGIARTIFTKICTEECPEYPECTIEWLTSDEFRMNNQDTYIERSREISEMEKNEEKVLWHSYYRLLDDDLIDSVKGLKMFWSKDKSITKAGQSSCLMKVVIMNRRFLDRDVPYEVLDYCLLNEIANITTDFGMDAIERKVKVAEILAKYPDKDTARRWLDRVMMEV